MFLRKFSKSLKAALLSKMDTSVKPPVEPCKKIIEGKAVITLLTDKVFYNPVQEFNRDLSVAVLNVFAPDYAVEKIARFRKKAATKYGTTPAVAEEKEKILGQFTILEPLSATGLRAIRYAKEVPNVAKITANDLSPKAVEVIKENILSNGVEEQVFPNHDDACMVMYKHKNKRFAAIDLDPYGCPSQFLDAAVQAVENAGLLLITATDMAVLAGNSPETCYAKYGAVSLKTKACHEMALRILLQCIASHASRNGRYIVPLLSISADFYIRVFVKVYSGLEKVKKTSSKLSMVYQCVGCGTMTLQQLVGFKSNPTEKLLHLEKSFVPTVPPLGINCVHCNSKHRVGGPIWSAPIHDNEFVSRVLNHVQTHPDDFRTTKRLQGVLSMIHEELDEPLYYTTEQLTGTVHVETMKMKLLRSAIMNAGFKVSYSHAWKNSLKTNAPAQFMWDIIRSWALNHPVKRERLESEPVAKFLLSRPIQRKIDWTLHMDANPVSRRDRCLRFQANPTAYWGPGAKSAVNIGDKINERRIAKQDTRRGKRKLSPDSIDEARKKSNANQTEVEANIKLDDVVVLDTDTEPNDDVVPDTNTNPNDDVVSDTNTNPNDVVTPDTNTKPNDVVVPDTNTKPNDVVVPDTNTKLNDVVVPDTNTKPNDVVVPNTTTSNTVQDGDKTK